MIKLKISDIQGYGDGERIRKCVKRLEAVLNSSEFKELVLAFEVKGKRKFKRSGGLNNAEVLDWLLHGDATSLVKGRHVAKLKLTLEWSPSGSCIGFVKAGRIHTYQSYFHEHGDSWMVAHLAHEYAHLAGFTHTFHWTASRKNTVPYAIGELAFKAYHQIWPGEDSVTCAPSSFLTSFSRTWFGETLRYLFS